MNSESCLSTLSGISFHLLCLLSHSLRLSFATVFFLSLVHAWLSQTGWWCVQWEEPNRHNFGVFCIDEETYGNMIQSTKMQHAPGVCSLPRSLGFPLRRAPMNESACARWRIPAAVFILTSVYSFLPLLLPLGYSFLNIALISAWSAGVINW